MGWKVVYHPDVKSDLKSLGPSKARYILKVIDDKIIEGHPDKIGFPLRNSLSGYKKLRIGDCRLVYRVSKEKVEILILAIGLRRNEKIYKTASKRIF
jgi:mRNA interferase RelE/StbE